MNISLTRPNWLNIEPRSEKFLWLDKNENTDIEYLNWIKDFMKDKIFETDYSTYPDLRDFYLKLSLIDNISAENLLLTNGSDGAIRTVFQTFINENDLVFITNPSFAMYDVYCKLYMANTFNIEYIYENDKIGFNLENLIKEIDKQKPKLVCLPNPDSPTGTVLNQNEMKDLLLICRKSNTLLFIDEAYYPFYNFTSTVFLNDFSNLIICRTFSKAWGLAGVRVGYLLSNPQLTNLMNLTRPMYEIGALQLKIVYEIISHPDKMKESVLKLLDGKRYFETELKNLNFKVLDTYGNFSHVDFGAKKGLITKELDKSILYRKNFSHIALGNYSRFSSAPINIMKNVINKIKKLS